MKIANDKFGAVAIQQALVKYYSLTIRRAAGIAQVHPRTLHNHVQAKPGSNVAAWETRTDTAQAGAIEAARVLIATAQKLSEDLAGL